MEKHIKPANMNVSVSFDDISLCPICNYKISPKYIDGYAHMIKSSFSLYCECPSCGKPFIAYYKNLINEGTSSYPNYFAKNIEYLAPIFPNVRNFDKRIAELSPYFVETYNQSLSAESYNLNQIAGMGYRKALEFLIKDYCILKNPDSKSDILNMFLGNCINTYIDDSKIKSLTKLSVWLGNDETHYIRKFENKDINDLKRFIDTTVYFVLYNLNADEADEIVNSQ